MTVNVDLPDYAERLLRARRSTRAFRPDPVPEDTIRALFELASTAPSASNTQPWQVGIVSGAAKEKLSQDLLAAAEQDHKTPDFPHEPSTYSDAQNARRQETGALMYDTLGIARDDYAAREEQYLNNMRFFGAPHVALMFVPTNANVLMYNDIGMYTQNLLLAMTAYGIASCTQGIIAWYADAVRASLGVTDSRLMYGVAFGYADEGAPINRVRTPRAPLADFGRFWN